ncbi:hypothetical protein DFH08DRAFT_953669 [Mycena albidolilacea]|uniref:Uncharacterized protein n=1 Tax=Mycena albidolilacea TaxID=1033008 RepID=A0AAD7F0D7_9AGAR|nr:hypothetical protein DFH08DRAFT_953669 [Mycena albidolilacea]
MDPIYFQDGLGNLLTPIWSKIDDVEVCSILSTPASIAPQIMKFRDAAPALLTPETTLELIDALDFTTHAVWYKSSEHWKPWIPTGAPRASAFETESPLDLLAICFGRDVVPTEEILYEDYDSDHPITPVERYAGCHLARGLIEEAVYLGGRLHDIILTLVESSDFYRLGPPAYRNGDVPSALDDEEIKLAFSSEHAALQAAAKARRQLLSMLGFLSWFTSLIQLEHTRLSPGDRMYLRQLRLDERPKTGGIFDLTRDVHEINFAHLTNNGVGFHYIWTPVEEENGRLRRFSPAYYEEIARVRASGLEEGITHKDLPSYAAWKDDLEGSNWLGENLRAGKMGSVWTSFKPSMKYELVDRYKYGARELTNWYTIRVYAERFKALIREGQRDTVCTFFRNNPIHVDEPPHARPPMDHLYSLSMFADSELGSAIPERDSWYESTVISHEKAKNLYAPRLDEDRLFNSFNGGRTLGPLQDFRASTNLRRVLPQAEASTSRSRGRDRRLQEDLSHSRPFRSGSRSPGPRVESSWGRKMISAPTAARVRSPRSLSPGNHRTGYPVQRSRSLSPTGSVESESDRMSSDEDAKSIASSMEVYTERKTEGVQRSNPGSISRLSPAHSSGHDTPFHSASASTPAWTVDYQVEETATDALTAWASTVVEFDPKGPAYDPLSWNSDWLESAYLSSDDPRTFPRLKALAAIYRSEMNDIRVVLEYAMRFGMQFNLFVKLEDAGNFRNLQLSPLAVNTLPALYEMGYNDPVMKWGGNGDAAQFGQYIGSLFSLLQKPNAIAFISMGGICKYVAELFAPDLAYRFVHGPSELVSELGKGRTARININGRSTLCITDQVSNADVSILLGHVKGKNPGEERSLWPTQALLDQHCAHAKGYISSGVHGQLEYLRKQIMVDKIYDWKTRTGWKAYLRSGSKGVRAPTSVPSESDFEEGNRILKRSYPEDWQHKVVAGIVLPEIFQPQTFRD